MVAGLVRVQREFRKHRSFATSVTRERWEKMIEWREELAFEDKRERRGVAIYAASKKVSDSGLLIYGADGQSTKTIAEGFFRLHPKSDVCFVGVDCSIEHRNAEYVDGRNPELFASHEHFFTRTVPAWVQSKLNRTEYPARTTVFGYSCGGAFAASMGICHPERYGISYAFSIAGRPVQRFTTPADKSLATSKFYLRSGDLEPAGMHSYTDKLAIWLKNAGAFVDNAVEPGDHYLEFWCRMLYSAIEQ